MPESGLCVRKARVRFVFRKMKLKKNQVNFLFRNIIMFFFYFAVKILLTEKKHSEFPTPE